VRERHRDETEARDERGDKHWAKSIGGAMLYRFLHILTPPPERVDMTHHDDAVEDSNSKQSDEANTGRKIQVDVRNPQSRNSTNKS
jgi:hypothetical protein